MHTIKPHDDALDLTYAGRDFCEPVPRNFLPKKGMPARHAYQLIHDELRLDGQTTLNLASFVTTWMEPEARELVAETAAKNLIDHDEYAQTAEIERRVVNMMAGLLHAPADGDACGVSTVGSSEALILGLMAHKRSWQNRRRAAGQSADRPNVIFGADGHTCLEKFTRYFEVEARIVPLASRDYVLHAEDVAQHIDENTIAVVGIVGTTFTGQMDAVVAIDALLRKVKSERGWHIPMHIDAASGGFILPFTRPDVVWDFRLPSVHSINVSNHKFGLVYPGMGTLVFRSRHDLPEELVFHINYLGGDMPNYSLNFSRPSGQVVAQYYNFMRLGHEGYTRIMQNIMKNARYLAGQLSEMGGWRVIGDGMLFPVVVAAAADPQTLDVFAVAERLKAYGWVVPAYTLPPEAQETAVLRWVVRESLSRDLVDKLVENIRSIVKGDRHDAQRHTKHGKKPRLVC